MTDNESESGYLNQMQPCDIEGAIAELIARDFSLQARLDRATRQHRARRHLLRFQRLSKAVEIAA